MHFFPAMNLWPPELKCTQYSFEYTSLTVLVLTEVLGFALQPVYPQHSIKPQQNIYNSTQEIS